jgi:sporulation protein YlmC with PRC-barrel domain
LDLIPSARATQSRGLLFPSSEASNPMNKKNAGLVIGGVLAMLAGAQISPALAQDATMTPAAPAAGTSTDASTNLGVTPVDAGKLIGKDVIDANGKTVGEIESVIVTPKGKVSSVVLDVSGWLESEKRVSVPWQDLKADADGNIHSSLTKESARAAADYKYSTDVNRGKVLNESGQVYAANGTQEPTTAGMTTTNDTSNATQNVDGSLNASKVVGLSVVNNANDSIGKISEVLLDNSGKVSGVVVDVGGFLGIGTHPVKLGWNQIKIQNNDGSMEGVVNLNKDALKQMPEYKASNG